MRGHRAGGEEEVLEPGTPLSHSCLAGEGGSLLGPGRKGCAGISSSPPLKTSPILRRFPEEDT